MALVAVIVLALGVSSVGALGLSADWSAPWGIWLCLLSGGTAP